MLTDTDETRARYPFAFALEIGFRVTGATLAIEAVVRNTGSVAMPASFGFHPAFAWPLPYGEDRAAHRIVFAADEPDRLKEIAPDGTIADATRESPLDGRTLDLTDALFANDALLWDRVRSDRVTYGAARGPRLEIGFPSESINETGGAGPILARSLDSRAGAEILTFLRNAVRELDQTVVMVTHDPTAAAYADRAVFLADGRVVDDLAEPTAITVLDRMKNIGS